jgi:von Willebrand factor type A domain
MSKVCFALVTVSCAAALLACGSEQTSAFGDPPPPDQGLGGPDLGGGFSTDPVGTNAACVTAIKNASLPAVNLVIMYDKSGSMGNPAEGGDPSSKWVPVNTGMKAFFADTASAGYNASLQFFPAPGDLATTCGAAYDQPIVPLTSLTDSAPLSAALDAASPQGGTPTLPALVGAISYAQQTAAARPDEKTVVVLVTDGEPGIMVNGQFAPGCTNNDIAHVASAAATGLAASIPTYVIGVGTSLTKLEAIAQAGGTNQAFLIPVSNPTATRAELQKAFESVRSQQKVSCNFAMPKAPEGQTLDKDRINVAFTPATGGVTPLVYSKDCTADNGWRYDNPAAPTQIELCPSACSNAQHDPNGKLSVAVGCKTNIEVR